MRDRAAGLRCWPEMEEDERWCWCMCGSYNTAFIATDKLISLKYLDAGDGSSLPRRAAASRPYAHHASVH